MNILPFPKRATVIRALCDGNSIRGTSRIVQVDKNTVMWLGRDVGEGYFNLCRVHETIGKTPAMAQKATRHVWSVEEFIAECLKRCDRSRPPVRLGDQRYEEVICKRGVCDVEKAGKSA